MREGSGLKGSLSTYTLTENQSIVWGAGWGGMGVREGKEEQEEASETHMYNICVLPN